LVFRPGIGRIRPIARELCQKKGIALGSRASVFTPGPRSFAMLEAGASGALAAFAAHVGKEPQDQLASHLKRLLNGASGTRIVIDLSRLTVFLRCT